MNRALSLTIILATFSLGAWGQTPLGEVLSPLNDDIAALLGSIGSDLTPQLLQTTLAGDIVGEAAFKGGFPHGSISIPAIGVGLGNGIATVLNDGARTWAFTPSPLPTIIQTAIGGTSDAYKATRQVFPYPVIALGAGFGITRSIEVLVNGMYWPQGLTGAVVGLLPSNVATMDPTFSASSVVVKVRKVLLHDVGGYPAISIALGGVYGKIDLGANINLADLSGGPIDLSGIGTLNIVGPMSFEATVLGAGLEFAISKRLPVITPFAKVGVWYRHAVVTSTTDLTATIVATDGTSSVSQKIQASPEAVDEGIYGRVAAGLEIRIWAFIIHFSAALDLENPLVDIKSFTLTGIAANGLSLSTGFRLSF